MLMARFSGLGTFLRARVSGNEPCTPCYSLVSLNSVLNPWCDGIFIVHRGLYDGFIVTSGMWMLLGLDVGYYHATHSALQHRDFTSRKWDIML